MRYRKKAVEIEATQWFKDGDHDYVIPIPLSVRTSEVLKTANGDFSKLRWISTLEGGHVVAPGDWIITGVKGEMYPCKPDIFEMTYEAVEESELARIDALPGKQWSAKAALGDALATVKDNTPLLIIYIDEGHATRFWSANMDNKTAFWMTSKIASDIMWETK